MVKTTRKTTTRTTSGKHSTTKCPQCGEEMSNANLSRHIKRAHKPQEESEAPGNSIP